MPFKNVKRSTVTVETPEALFRDLRNRRVEGLLSHQADILRAYCEKMIPAADVALQLPTGSGKTLVGLLAGEWRRRRFEDNVVYLCPTRQLVNQVVEQARDLYGIRANAFTGKQADYSATIRAEYYNNEVLSVTTYSGLFNTNPFFSDPDVIILDDAHAAENYIAAHWSLRIDRHDDQTAKVFAAVVAALRSAVSLTDYNRLAKPTDQPWDTTWIEKIPTPVLHTVLDGLRAVLDENVAETDLKYPWTVLRDHLSACHVYISANSILIRPTIPPTRTHPPFARAKQRLYMSATLGNGGDLERLTGARKIERIAVPEGWDKQGIGRRLFFFPERSLDQEASHAVCCSMIKAARRALVLVPDNKAAADFRGAVERQTGFSTIDASQLEQSKHPFVDTPNTVAVVANRYDGIDLTGEECRLLVVSELPRAVNLQERFLMTRLAATILLNDRILTRIVQAVGRCTRSANDYAAVVVLGESLSSYFLKPEHRAFLHPEIQAEVEFGVEQSREASEADFLDYFRIFLDHGQEWNNADDDILSLREDMTQKQLPATDKLRAAVSHEVDYQMAVWNGDYESALEHCRKVLTHLGGDDVQGYRAFWNYLAGSAAWLASRAGTSSLAPVARDYFKRAGQTAPGVRWFLELSRHRLTDDEPQPADARLAAVIEGLEEQLDGLGTIHDRAFEAEVNAILSGLAEQDPTRFEDAHVRLGRLLGYRAQNTDATSGPDPWWIAGDSLCIVHEDHSQSEEGNSIGSTKVRQAALHPKWIRENVALPPEVEIVAVLVSPCRTLEPDALVFADETGYWNIADLRAWATNALAVVRDLRRSFPGPGDAQWQARAIQEYRAAGLDPASLVERVRKNPLRALVESLAEDA